MTLPLRPQRGGFLRPFGCGWFIREFLLGHGPNGSPRIDPDVYADHLQDVNEDGYIDLVSHYVSSESGIVSGDTSACLSGEYGGGLPFTGCDSVRTLH